MTQKIYPCTLCGSYDIEPIDSQIRNVTDNLHKMYRCNSCDTHFLYPQFAEEQLEAYYDGQFREEVHTSKYYDEATLTKVYDRFYPEAQQRVARVEAEIKPSDEILEIGCSVGYFLNAVSNKVKNVFGTEWDNRALSYIDDVLQNSKIKTAHNPQDFEQGFDKIFMFHVLEHIANPVEFLIKLKPLLKDNGCIYIEVPNVDDIMVKTFNNSAFKDFYYKKAHLFNFNEKGLSYVFEKSGYHYQIEFIQRYDISNHFYWLANQKPGGKGAYTHLLSSSLNEEYIQCLKTAKQTDTLFARLTL